MPATISITCIRFERLAAQLDANGPSPSRFQPAAVKPTSTVEAMEQLDVRVGTVVKVDDVAGAARLSRLTVDFGDRQRTIVAGIKKERSEPQLVQGQQALFVVNIPPAPSTVSSQKACCSTSGSLTACARLLRNQSGPCQTVRARVESA